MNREKYIDPRPLWLLFLLEYKRFFLALGSFALFIAILALPTPEGLSEAGLKTLALFVLCTTLWVTQALPMSVTGLLIFALLSLLGIMDGGKAFSLFGNQAVFFILASFILAAAIMASGLSTRVAFLLLNYFDSSPRKLLAGLMLISAFFTFFMPEHAVAALFLPIVLEIARSLHLKPGYSRYGKSLFLSVTWGCVIGGITTFLGGARNPLAIAILHEYNGQTISFMDWFIHVIPVTGTMLLIALLLIKYKFRPDIDDITSATSYISEKLEEMGRISFREKSILIIFLGTVFFWVILGEEGGLAEIGIVSVALLFLLNLISWEDIEENVNWGVILMYGGAIAIGKAMDTSGCAFWLVNQIFPEHASVFWLVLIIAAIGIFLTEGMSNSAVVVLLLPVTLTMSQKFGIDPVIMVYVVALSSGLSFMLPTSCPANAICYSAGYYTVAEVLAIGLFLNVSAVLVLTFASTLLWPLY